MGSAVCDSGRTIIFSALLLSKTIARAVLYALMSTPPRQLDGTQYTTRVGVYILRVLVPRGYHNHLSVWRASNFGAKNAPAYALLKCNLPKRPWHKANSARRPLSQCSPLLLDTVSYDVIPRTEKYRKRQHFVTDTKYRTRTIPKTTTKRERKMRLTWGGYGTALPPRQRRQPIETKEGKRFAKHYFLRADMRQ